MFGWCVIDWEFKGVLLCVELGLCDLVVGWVMLVSCVCDSKELIEFDGVVGWIVGVLVGE